jgi:hypothetical protein
MTSPIDEGNVLIAVTTAGVTVDEATGWCFLELVEAAGGRGLEILVGRPEAAAIAFGLQQVPWSRPLTHDAFKDLLDAVHARLGRIVVGFDQAENTFTADVELALADGGERHVDWRVSDAVALAVRCHPAPDILVPDALLADPPANVPASPK